MNSVVITSVRQPQHSVSKNNDESKKLREKDVSSIIHNQVKLIINIQYDNDDLKGPMLKVKVTILLKRVNSKFLVLPSWPGIVPAWPCASPDYCLHGGLG